jgi:hypothetical protein
MPGPITFDLYAGFAEHREQGWRLRRSRQETPCHGDGALIAVRHQAEAP